MMYPATFVIDYFCFFNYTDKYSRMPKSRDGYVYFKRVGLVKNMVTWGLCIYLCMYLYLNHITRVFRRRNLMFHTSTTNLFHVCVNYYMAEYFPPKWSLC